MSLRSTCRHRSFWSYLTLTTALTIATTWAVAAGISSHELRQHTQRIEMFDALIENMDSACAVTDSHGIVKVWNRKAVADFGWTRDEMLDTNIELVIPEEHREEFRAAVRNVLTTASKPKGKQRVKAWAITKARKQMAIDLSIRVVPSGSDVYFLAIVDKPQEVPTVVVEKPVEPTPTRTPLEFRQAAND